MSNVNYSKVIFWIEPSTRAILCDYENYEKSKMSDKKLFKTLDQSIKVGDYVVVPTTSRHEMAVVKVIETEGLEVDFEDSFQMQWIISKIDTETHKEICEKEANAIKFMKSANLKQKQMEMQKNLQDLYGSNLPNFQLTDQTEK